MHDLAIAALTLRGFQHQHLISRAEQAGLVALLDRQIAERDGRVRLAPARNSFKVLSNSAFRERLRLS